jgi:hypothetical protein
MILFYQSLIFSSLLLAVQGNSRIGRGIFFCFTAVILGLYLAMQKPGTSADYFNYLEVYNNWFNHYRVYYATHKYELIFTYIVDFAKEIGSFKSIYFIYGCINAVFLILALRIAKRYIDVYALYALSFCFLGLSANMLSGIRYILVTFIIFYVFIKLFDILKKANPSNTRKSISIIVPLLIVTQLSHQTGIFSIITVLSALALSRKPSPLEKIKLPFSHLIWIFFLAFVTIISMQYAFIKINDALGLPFSGYITKIGNMNNESVGLSTLLSRFLWLGLVCFVTSRLPKKLSVEERFCYYNLIFFTIFYFFAIYISPLFRLSNMLCLISGFCLFYLVGISRNQKFVTQVITLASLGLFTIRAIQGGGEYGYTIDGF